METRTKYIARTLPALALAVSLSALGLSAASPAQADGTLACSSLGSVSSAQGAGAQGQLDILKAENLYRFQARPWARIPEGVALHVRAPAGMTAADLHNAVSECARAAKDASSPLCVPGAAINVARNGGNYVVKITSDARADALEIQQRTARIK